MSPVNAIDGNQFAAALISGIHRVIGAQEYLNQINVFPVADSDTGTNLSLSLGSALSVLAGDEEKHLGTLLAAFADALLDSARGNSGSISTDEFYAELENNPHHPTTSQPAPGDFRRQYQFLASHFRDVLSISLTSHASGTHQAALSAAAPDSHRSNVVIRQGWVCRIPGRPQQPERTVCTLRRKTCNRSSESRCRAC